MLDQSHTMSRIDKLAWQLKSVPTGFQRDAVAALHKPHPSKVLKEYQVRHVLGVLLKEGLI